VNRRLEESYGEFERVEEAFRAALDESLRPRSPELLYEIVEGLGLPEGSVVVDVGCGDGRHSFRQVPRPFRSRTRASISSGVVTS
jgi:cyclopropane fatty-acyl-phospholipid synthase-like methyltransferase